MSPAVLAKLRALCLALPGVTEVVGLLLGKRIDWAEVKLLLPESHALLAPAREAAP